MTTCTAVNENFISCPKTFIILSESIFDLANIISFLFNNKGNSLSIKSVTILIFLQPIFAGIVTDFSELTIFHPQT